MESLVDAQPHATHLTSITRVVDACIMVKIVATQWAIGLFAEKSLIAPAAAIETAVLDGFGEVGYLNIGRTL